MKYRSDFVTNSSSSSFVVAFKTVPKNVNELKELMFGDQESIEYPYYHSDYNKPEEASISTYEIAKVVFNEMKAQTPNDKEKIKENMEGYYEDSPDIDSFYETKNGKKEINWDKFHKAYGDHMDKKYKELMKDFKNFKIYCFEYSDNGEGIMGQTMEHGNIFNRLPHKRISHH